MKLKNLFILAISAIVLASCGSKTNESKSEVTEELSSSLSVDDLLLNADSLTDQEILIEGICTHTCKHGATKIFVMGSDDTKTIRVEAASLGSFDQKCINSIVRIKGILREERVDEAYLQRWEAASSVQAEQHGETEAGCDTEKAARGEKGNSVVERIADFRAKIAARKEVCGKEYLSFYFVEALAYEILE
ncbi:MAG: hypothetical protein IKU79_00575 [Bacteroidaceae bacterium]|jgi:hypothetical protein|nr:hypothetical protein [Bacteroidaceae bacterium]